MDRDELMRVLRAFESRGLEYVLIGAAAMGFHRLIRATEDVDLMIRPTPENVERLRCAFRVAYPDDPNVDDIRAEDLLGDYPAVRYYPPSGEIFFDILTRCGEAASCDTVESEIREVEGIRVRIATPQALYRLKKGSVRPLDRRDALSCRSGSNCGRTEVPVEKFRSVGEMNAAPIRVDTEKGFERFIRHCARFRKIAGCRYPAGVFRFRSLEEAQAARVTAAAGMVPDAGQD